MEINEIRKRIVSVDGAVKTSGYPLSKSAWRHLIFKAMPRFNSKGEMMPTNGLVECGAIIKLGRKVLIDLDRFDLWMEKHRVTDGCNEPTIAGTKIEF